MSLRFAYNTNGTASHRLDDALMLMAEIGYGGGRPDPGLQPFRPVREGVGSRRPQAGAAAAGVEVRLGDRDRGPLPARPSGEARADPGDGRPGRPGAPHRLPAPRHRHRQPARVGGGLVLGRSAEARRRPRRGLELDAAGARTGGGLCGPSRDHGGAGTRARHAGRDRGRLSPPAIGPAGAQAGARRRPSPGDGRARSGRDGSGLQGPPRHRHDRGI